MEEIKKLINQICDEMHNAIDEANYQSHSKNDQAEKMHYYIEAIRKEYLEKNK